MICHSVSSGEDLKNLIATVDGAVVGPGLGRSAWAYDVWRAVVRTDVPLVLDADGLNWLAAEPFERDEWLLTPHVGEAARLLPGATVGVGATRPARVRACAGGALRVASPY